MPQKKNALAEIGAMKTAIEFVFFLGILSEQTIFCLSPKTS